MVLRSLVFSCALVLSACASHGSQTPRAPLSPEAKRAEQLAQLVLTTAQTHPDRIMRADAEIAALEAALQDQASQSQAASILAPVPGPVSAPDLRGAVSLLSGVHLASYRERRHADSGWRTLQAQAGVLLDGLQPRLIEVDLGEQGRFLRLKAGPLDNPQAARALCRQLEASGVWCQPTHYSGEDL